jgi:hypothetical protein
MEIGISNRVARHITPLLCTSLDSGAAGVPSTGQLALQARLGAHPPATTVTRPAASNQISSTPPVHSTSTVLQGALPPLSQQTAPFPVSSSAHAIPPSNLGIVRLEDGELAFDKTKVMRPPAVRFSTDISALFREWHESTYLVVNGRGIPIKHWGDVYKRCTVENGKAWSLRKVQWGQWKVSLGCSPRFLPSERCIDHRAHSSSWRNAHAMDLMRHSGRSGAIPMVSASGTPTYAMLCSVSVWHATHRTQQQHAHSLAATSTVRMHEVHSGILSLGRPG